MVPIDLTCDHCGSNRLALDKSLDDQSHVNCEECGQTIGTMAELKRAMEAAVLTRTQARERGTQALTDS